MGLKKEKATPESEPIVANERIAELETTYDAGCGDIYLCVENFTAKDFAYLVSQIARLIEEPGAHVLGSLFMHSTTTGSTQATGTNFPV